VDHQLQKVVGVVEEEASLLQNYLVLEVVLQ